MGIGQPGLLHAGVQLIVVVYLVASLDSECDKVWNFVCIEY